MPEKLHRNRSDALLGGVCAGLANHFQVDANLIRILFIALALLDGTGIVIYLAMWVLLPASGSPPPYDAKATARHGAEEIVETARQISRDLRNERRRNADQPASVLIALLLVVLGLVFLLQNLGWTWAPWFRFATLWPLILVAAGAYMLWHRASGE